MASGLYGVAGAAAALLLWVTVKPLVRKSPAWLPQPSVKLNWGETLRSRPLSRIGVALEHTPADAEILNRALSLAQTHAAPSDLVLLHVVDTAMTRVLGPETADRESEADERYLSDLVESLHDRGYAARAVLLHGPDRLPASWWPAPPARSAGRSPGRRVARAMVWFATYFSARTV